MLRWHLLTMDVQQVVKEIHARLQAEAARDESAPASHLSQSEIGELATLDVACRHLYEVRNLVGQTPPMPNSFRARAGGFLVRLVQRALFWYTPQIHRFQNEAAAALLSARILIERQFEAIGKLQQEVHALQRKQALEELSSTRAITAGLPPSTAAPQEALPEAFIFALQDHFRGSETVTAQGQSIWLRTLEALADPAAPEATWLDIGCGRGEWLSLAAHAGHTVAGIDSNAASVAHCAARGLQAEAAEAIDYLRSLPEASLGVVTAFHVVEHLPMTTLLSLVVQVARTLRPGGLFAIETPNPGNLQMAAWHFWNDPTHQRPIPPALLEFIFSYCGLPTVKRVDLNPAPAHEHLPYSEVDLVRQVDGLLYGPRDYGLVGRREA